MRYRAILCTVACTLTLQIAEIEAQQRPGPAVTLAAEPDLVIGRVSGDPHYELHGVRGAASLPDGRIAIVDWGSSEVRFYSESGAYLGAVGGAGDGPTEFRHPSLLSAARYDSLLVSHRMSRIKSVQADGTVETVAEFNGPELPVGATARGILFSAVGGSIRGGASVGPRESWIRFFVRAGGRAPAAPPIERRYYHHFEGGQFGSTVPLTRTPLGAPGVDGFWITTGVDPVLEEYDLEHRLRRAIPLPLEAGPVDRGEFEDSIRARSRGLPYAELREAYRDMPAPEKRPLVDALVPDAAGGVWVLATGDGSRPRRWLVIQGGAVRGWAETPPGLEVLSIGRDHLLAVTRDAYDVERVERYRITRHEP